MARTMLQRAQGGTLFRGKVAGRELTGEFLLFALSTGVFQASRFGTFIVAAKWTSPDEFGVWNALQLVILYGVVTMIGVPNGMIRQVPFLLGKGESSAAARVEDTSFWFTLLASLSVGVIVGGAGLAGIGAESYRTPMLTLSALFPAWHMYQYFQARLRSRLRFNLVSAQQFLFAGLLPVVTLPLVAVWRIPGFIAGQALTAVLLIPFVYVKAGMRIHWPKEWTGLRDLAQIGFPIMLAGLVYSLLISVDRILVLNVLGTEALGLYTLPILCITALNLLPAVVSQQMYPRMAFRYGETQDMRALWSMAVRQSAAAGLAVLPVLVVIYVALPYLTTHFLTQYTDGVAPARVLLVGLGVVALSGGAGNLLNTVGKQVYYVAVLAVAVLLNAAVIATLLALGKGLVGVAGGAALSYALFTIMVNLVALHVVRKSR